MMLFSLPDHDTLYAALEARDPSYDGLAYVGVTTTGIFCRLTCPARNPKRENTQFYATVAECLEAGFRPCKRCKPLARTGEMSDIVKTLTEALEADPARRWREDDIIAMGLDPSTVRRAFKRHLGITFLDMARLRRLGLAADQLAAGVPVIEAQLEAGFDSGSGFRAAVNRLIGEAPKSARTRVWLKADWIETPIGALLAIADNTHLHLLEFNDRKGLPGELKRLQADGRTAIGFGRAAPMDRIEAELEAYFEGRSARFETPLALHGSAFTRSVWDQLLTIPPGETWSYLDLARSIDRPSATRAVARANGANQIAIVIPCHRVIGSDGSLTGYGGGLWRKKWLIEHEKRNYSAQPAPAAIPA
ncbi:bifunctional transcriptional activator/DNA repair enzyme AdaA [Cucumibacter marinus]|uniref:bifunctional transcriptional activator/DNA repair enzyme AdaA n=1 Tax=Cucumibacter marinus TaxID=1121252 RepID=UPI0004210667|nr:trifunctional transcriptional activator/DNA repair protein Ada/methylated-DNA--[protein]-cysteine S-methyltransferase [Cucumibacter marinus]